MKSSQESSACITRFLHAPPEDVYAAWLNPQLVGQWMFGPKLREEEILHIKIDARVGGRFSFLVRRDGQELDHVGEYQELKRPKRLVFTWGIKGQGDGSRVVVDIKPHDTGSEVTVTHELTPEWISWKPKIEESWNKMVGVLADVI